MATTTLQAMRREFAHYLGYGEMVGKDGAAWTTTTDVAASALVISTELRDAGFDDPDEAGSGDDFFSNWYAWLLGSNNSQTQRRIKSYDASAGQLTVTGTNLSAESGATDFEIHKYQPTIIRDVLNTARLKAFPSLHIPVARTQFTASAQVRYQVPSAVIGTPYRIKLARAVDAASFANNILSNAGFENWTSGSPDSWTATSVDVAEETSTTTPKNYVVFKDGSATRCTSQASSTGTLLQSISSPGTHSGQRISMSIWVYCLTADIVSTAIKIGSTTNLGTAADGGLHGGTGWEMLTHFEDSTTTISSLDVGISVVSSATDNTEFYVDEAICVVGTLQEPEYEWETLRNWDYNPIVQGTTLRNEVVFPHQIPDNRLMRFEGTGYLSSLSAETDTMEISKPQTELLYAHAKTELFIRKAASSSGSDDRYDEAQIRAGRIDIDRLGHLAQPRQRRLFTIPTYGV